MKLNLIYYKNLLDVAIEKFISCYSDFFTKENGKYVLGLSISKKKLSKVLEECIDESIQEVTRDASKTDNNVLLVIGSCYPKDNLLLSFKDDAYFPKKLAQLLESKPSLKWLLSESDIEVDIDLMNELLVDVFNKRFKCNDAKRCCSNMPKILYISHSSLDCYMMFKVVKWVFGSSNCCNIWKDKLQKQRQNLVAVNDLVSKYIHNKSRMNKSAKFKRCALEVRDYLCKQLGVEVS